MCDAKSERVNAVLVGGGGHAKQLLESIDHDRFDIVGVVDPSFGIGFVEGLGLMCLGDDDCLKSLTKKGISTAFIGLGALTKPLGRIRLYDLLLSHGFNLPSVVHKDATVSPSASIGAGVQLFARSYVGAGVVIRPNTIVNVGSIVSHDCNIGEHCHLTPGSILGGGVNIGNRCTIGMAATVLYGLHIGEDTIINNGVHIFSDVPQGKRVMATASPVRQYSGQGQ